MRYRKWFTDKGFNDLQQKPFEFLLIKLPESSLAHSSFCSTPQTLITKRKNFISIRIVQSHRACAWKALHLNIIRSRLYHMKRARVPVPRQSCFAVVIAFPIPFSVHIITNMNIHPTERALASFWVSVGMERATVNAIKKMKLRRFMKLY